MEECLQTLADYGLRSIGLGERLLPRSDFTLCHQITLIGSGMLWNIYFGVFALGLGFCLAVGLAMGKAAANLWIRKPAEWFIFTFRGSPLFIQFFFAYFLFLHIKGASPLLQPLSAAWLGALIVLTLNTAAYSGEIFYGAIKALPRGESEAADAFGLAGWTKFKRITFPNMMRLAWPAYTNEAIFLFHSTTLVFLSGFPARGQRGDALYYASYFADKTFNPFIPYPILAGYFIIWILLVTWVFGQVSKRLNRHLPQETAQRPRFSLTTLIR